MNVDKHIAHWRNGAEEDFEVARARMKRGDYRHGFFFAHLALEKMFKAHVAKVTGGAPPRGLTALRLAQLARLHLSGEQQLFLSRLWSHQIEGRILDEDELTPISEELAQSLMSETEETMQWLTRRL